MKTIKAQKWNIAFVIMVAVFIAACIYRSGDAAGRSSGIVAGYLKGTVAVYFSGDEEAFVEPAGKLSRYYAVTDAKEAASFVDGLNLVDTMLETGGYRTKGKIRNSILFMKRDGTYVQADFIDPNLRFYDAKGVIISEFEISKKSVKAIREYIRKSDAAVFSYTNVSR